MSTEILLRELEQRNITLWREQDNIRFKSADSPLSQADIERIRANKALLLKLLPEQDLEQCGPDDSAGGSQFDLSPMQQAYWIGEQPFYNNSCVAFYYHSYRVRKLDCQQLQSAISALLKKHPALRLRFSPQGQQRVLDYAPYQLEVVELVDLTDAQLADYVAERTDTIEDTFAGGKTPWPFKFNVYRNKSCSYVTMAFRLMVVDGVSFNLVLTDLIDFYHGKALSEDLMKGPQYRDYINYLSQRKSSPEYQEAIDYWQGRLAELAPSPELPLADHKLKYSGFKRLQHKLSTKLWKSLQQQAQSSGLSINTVLAGVFCDVLSLYSKTPRFTLNMLAADRPIDLAGFDALVGNCSTTILLEVDHSQPSFIARCEAIRDQVFSDFAFSSVPGVELIRQLQKLHGASDRPSMPVVFTSGLNLHQGSNDFCVNDDNWQLADTFLKTPQVWLDHQVYQEYDQLVCNWDYVPDVFAEGVIEQMFEVYKHWLTCLSKAEHYWHQRRIETPVLLNPASQIYNRVTAPLPTKRLHQGFIEVAQTQPELIALKTRFGQINYGDLYQTAAALALQIQKSVPGQSNLIAVYACKGIEQICAVLAVLLSGNSYLPIDSKIPQQRVNQILSLSEAKLVLADKETRIKLSEDWQKKSLATELDREADISDFTPLLVEINSLAYVIYTSGSTGTPKGVAISHLGAMNTIQDMIYRFGLSNNDSVLALSALNFDLSVYDIFASLSVGASLVIPDEQAIPDPENWCSLLAQYPVTVWNSVPALLEITLEYLSHQAQDLLASLRLVLLSGDWIPAPLVSRLATVLADECVCIGLGGATEASIWSNYYAIEEHLSDGWNSVPYGVPLSNQTMWVLDSQLSERPEWVEGELYIGGHGVALGYLNDREKTELAFITHPELGERLYRTGDLARTRQGLIEFLGRKDFQVKIRGYRIELKEIEANLDSIEGIRQAAVIVDQAGTAKANIVAFYTISPGLGIGVEAIKQQLANKLPAYMVPGSFQLLDEMPLSANGKVDRKALAGFVSKLHSCSTSTQKAPQSETEHQLFGIWQQLLGVRAHSITDSFFDLGGNSLLAVRLVSRIEQTFEIKLQLGRLFELNTIELLAAELDRLKGQHAIMQDRIILLAGGQFDKDIIMVHPVGGGILSYLELVAELDGVNIWGLQCLDSDHLSSDSMALTVKIYAEAIIQLSRGDGQPINLAGWSMGAVFSLAICQYLEQHGYKVNPPLLIDPWVANPAKRDQFNLTVAIQGFFNDVLGKHLSPPELDLPATIDKEEVFDLACSAYRQLGLEISLEQPELKRLFLIYYRNSLILREFDMQLPKSPTYLLLAGHSDRFSSLRPILTAFPNLNIEYIERYEDRTHWTVMAKEVLAPFAKHWLRQVVLKD